MSAAATKPFELVADSQATFRVVLDALARPGTVGTIPAADPRCPLPSARALAAVARTLLDHEVAFAIAPGFGDELEAFARYLATATGSRPAEIGAADFIVARGPLARGLLAAAKRGTLAYPDEGATILVLADGDEAGGVVADLTGAGIPGARTLKLPGLSADNLAERRAANAEAPRGIDLLLIDGAGHVIGLPRTTAIAAR